MTRSRDTSNIFDPNSDIVNSSELNIAINTASAAAVAYTDSELGTIDLSSAIQTASAAAASYTDAEINIIEASLIGTINTASGAVVTYLVDSAPATLDTLNELAAALGDDPNYATTITNSLASKLDSSTASTTYLTQSNASSTYLTQSNASSTYLTQSNASSTYILQSQFGYPVWNTTSGTLATIYDINSASIASVSAFNPLGGSVSFSSSNLPIGISLSQSGLIYGNPLDVTSTTVHNFDIYAQTNTGATNSRSFNIIVNPASDGSSSARAASSATAIYNLTGTTTSGLYWILGEGGIARQVYCDMTTLGEDGKPGFMLAGSWSQASEWTKTSTSTVTTLGSTPINAFSAIFGNFSIQHMRVHVSSNIDTRGSSAESDWYYYWSTPTTWKTVWSPNNGTNSNYISTTGINNGVSLPRISLKQFNYAKNLRFNYTVGQQWASLSDATSSTTQVWANWWSGLTTSGVSLGVYSYGNDAGGNGTDGTLALLAQNSTDNCTGQDAGTFNSKYGYDDGTLHAVSATSGTYTTGSSGVVNGSNTNMWMWIK